MSDSDSLSDWTVMETRGKEVADVDSESSDSSIEVVSIEGQEAVSFRCQLDEISDVPLEPDKKEDENDSAPSEVPLAAQMVERDGGLGACCMELVMMSAGEKDVDEQRGPLEEAPISVSGDDPNIPTLNSDLCAEKGRDESDEESDFVCLDANNAEEAGGEGESHNEVHPMVVMMERSTSSIGPSFNFFRQEEPVRHYEDDVSDRDSLADLDDDTESSVEDAVDDRIESEQSEVGSVQAQNDVGDLSAFADIGDLPLEVGNVARNYIHRPNNRLSTFLNTTVMLAAILTMGMSLGIIMAGDLEIEEWERAYDGQVKKTLEMESLLSKAELNFEGFEEVLTAYSDAELTGEPMANFITSMKGIVSDYKTCREAHKYLPTHDCKSFILANILTSISDLKRTLRKKKEPEENQTEKATDQNMSLREISSLHEERLLKGEGTSHKEIPVNKKPEVDITNLQRRLTREHGRALHWQQLYLYERRQRKRERENEELEDQRDRILWEKADEEEDRRLREQWEKEEEEEDRLDRLRWEQEEAEEDKKDRERWEREKAQITFDECFRVMSANLTGLAQNVLQWNTSRLHDFANLSMLMSSVAELKQSVVQSVKQLRRSTEAVASQTEKYDDSNSDKDRESHFDQKSITKYLQGALKGIKSEVDNILTSEGDDDEESEIENEFQAEDEAGFPDPQDSHKESDTNKWHKAFKSLFKMTSRSLKRFGHEIVETWKNVKSALKGKKSHHHDAGNGALSKTFPPHLIKNVCKSLYIPDQMTADIKKMDSVVVDIGCHCAENVRHIWYKTVLDKPCQVLGIYSYACNIDHMTLKREIKELQKSLGKLMKKDNVKPSAVSAFKYKTRRKRLEELQDFWDTWGDHELLMRQDRDWARCRLKWWSDVLSGGDFPNDASCRSVNLFSLLEGLVEKDTKRTSLEKSGNVVDRPVTNEKDTQEIVNDAVKAESSNVNSKPLVDVGFLELSKTLLHGESSENSLKEEDDDESLGINIYEEEEEEHDDDDDDDDEVEELDVVDDKKEADDHKDEKKLDKLSLFFMDVGFDLIQKMQKKDDHKDKKKLAIKFMEHDDDDDEVEELDVVDDKKEADDHKDEKKLDKLSSFFMDVGFDLIQKMQKKDDHKDKKKPDKLSSFFVDFGFDFIQKADNTEAANDTFDPLGSTPDHRDRLEDDEHGDSEKDWLLERAQHRLQLRRDKEKAAWMFDRASEREKLRGQDMEISQDWTLAKGELRAAMRKKEHESDWMFDRAKQRREKFKEKWMKEREGNAHDEQGRIQGMSSEEEFSHAHAKRHKKQKRGQKGQKHWKKGKRNKNKDKHNNSKKQRGKCEKGRKGCNKRKGKYRNGFKRIARQIVSTFFSP